MTEDASGEIAHIIGASLEDLRDIFADDDGVKEDKKPCQRHTEIS